jgi:3-isopropylmalate/(R)-2-methylmalate dehydratase small subunit
MVEPFAKVVGAAAPLMLRNIDTDTISPGSRPRKSRSKTGFSEHGSATLADDLFAGLRYDEEGEEIPSFILNRPEFRAARILLAGDNFGCGSSRESAVWMLREWGIRCVIAPSIGEIFANNCYANGLLPIVLPEATVNDLAKAAAPGHPSAIFEVNLETQTLTTPSGVTIAFRVPAFRRRGLLLGIDEIAVTLESAEAIDTCFANAARARPWIVPTAS